MAKHPPQREHEKQTNNKTSEAIVLSHDALAAEVCGNRMLYN